ncbi:hypothetical protein [Streptomyces sp. NBC_01443]|uniref:hypothetical protein n=1 Tax=Streptomyces sp. NBC_01443 TaxID=2903868 RepID=UPI002259814E|nr:hypothetical protein [Streptomyces sp. NBC_01443]MCX4632877.1 hypothetical protein [Streptomyces sp. NBC_01443]
MTTSGSGQPLTQLSTAVRRFAPRLTNPAVFAVQCTVPVGTAPRIAEFLRDFAPAGDAVEVAWNPEFLRESFAVEDIRPARPRLQHHPLLG